MIFSDYLKESADAPEVAVDVLADADPDTPEGEAVMADQVEAIMQTAAMEEATFFEGGEEAVEAYRHYLESQVVTEGIISNVAKNNNIIRLNARDDLKRRTAVACMVMAKSKHDPLFVKASKHKLLYRKYKAAIVAKYSKRAFKVARMSQAKHATEVKKEQIPKFQKDKLGNRTNFGTVFGS